VNWLGAVRTATGGMLRHKVQAVVLGMVLLVSTASATLGLALLAASDAPFQHAFAAQDGAHLTVTVNPAHAGVAQLAGTRTLRGVTAMAGPFAEATVPTQWQGQGFGQLVLVGRASPGGPVDDAVLTAGHWVTGPGQIVLDAPSGGGGPVLGNTITVTGLKHPVNLTVVGFANSVTYSADGWVAPSQVASLQQPFTPASAELLYRFASAGSEAQIRADLAEVTGALPPGTVTGSDSWLGAESQNTSNGAIMEPFVVAFALIGLAMAVLIVANVVSGAVAAGYYRIGVLKSIGLTPAQVVMAYLSRVGVPALAGCVLGVVAGNVLAASVLHQSAGAYGVGSQSVPLWASVLAPTGMLALTVLAAFGPALRAGRLSATQAIAAGRAPTAGRGYAVHRLAARLRLPRPVGLGLAAPFARPARTLVSLAAIAFGATAVIFAFGLSASLHRAASYQNLSATVPVEIQQNGPDGGPGQPSAAAEAEKVDAVLRAQPGTAHQTAVYVNQVKLPGIAGNANAWAFSNDSSWIGYGVIAGHWYDESGQVDVNTAFLTDSGLSIGDTATIDTGTAPVTVHIVGEVFYPSSDPTVYGSTQTLPGVGTVGNLQQWDVGLRPETSTAGYVQAVNNALGASNPWQATTQKDGGQFYTIAIGLVGVLALMVGVAAGLGVLNTVLMTTRDRVHDLGIFKALGMRPGQMLTMVVCWIVGPAVIAGAIAAPVAMALNTATVHAMAGTAHTGVPADVTQVFPPGRLALLSLAALAIAAIGALAPASWAARARPAVALRTE
jgi:putative ABC transport system permease protein